MLDSTLTLNLLTFARHLLRQQSNAAIVNEFIRELRDFGVSVYYPASANLANRPDDIDMSEPIIIHLPGESVRTIVLGLDTNFHNPNIDLTYFEPDEAEENFEPGSKGKYLFGPGVLSVVAPLTIASWLVKELKELKSQLPGNLLIVLTPCNSVGNKSYAKTISKLEEFIEEKKLKPILTLVPGRVRQGTTKKKKIPLIPRAKKMEFVAGSSGVLTVQFLVKGISASPISRFSALDSTTLASSVMTKIAQSDIFWESTFDYPLVPPVFTSIQTEKNPTPYYTPKWSTFTATFFYDEIEPSIILSQLRTLAFETFSKYISFINKQFNTYAEQTKGVVKKSNMIHWKTKVLSYRELKKECTKEIPEIQLTDNPTLQEIQDASFQKLLFVAENGPFQEKPLIAYSLVPPVMPNYKLDANILVWPILKRALKDYGGKLSPWGMLDTAWQREMFNMWSSRNLRLWNDEAPIGDLAAGFSPHQRELLGPVVAFGPEGFDEGLKTERLLVDPAFTKLPELLKSLIVKTLTLEEHTTFVDKVVKKFRSISSRLGFSKAVDDFEDDDDVSKEDDEYAATDEKISDNHNDDYF